MLFLLLASGSGKQNGRTVKSGSISEQNREQYREYKHVKATQNADMKRQQELYEKSVETRRAQEMRQREVGHKRGKFIYCSTSTRSILEGLRSMLQRPAKGPHAIRFPCIWVQRQRVNLKIYRRSWYFHSKIVDSLTAWLGGKRKTGFS